MWNWQIAPFGDLLFSAWTITVTHSVLYVCVHIKKQLCYLLRLSIWSSVDLMITKWMWMYYEKYFFVITMASRRYYFLVLMLTALAIAKEKCLFTYVFFLLLVCWRLYSSTWNTQNNSMSWTIKKNLFKFSSSFQWPKLLIVLTLSTVSIEFLPWSISCARAH